MAFFQGMEKPPEDALLGLNAQFREDTSSVKVNLTVGAYRCGDGLPAPLPVVREVEQRLALDVEHHHEYLPIDGSPDFRARVAELQFGAESEALKAGRVATVQTVGGTGAVRLAFELALKCGLGRPPAADLAETEGEDASLSAASSEEEQVGGGAGAMCVYLPEFTWPNHPKIIHAAGVPVSSVRSYRYYDSDKKVLAMEGMLEDLRAAPRGSIVVLHMCAHNPTGMDPSVAQWGSIAQVVEERGLLTLFDNAYQGFATGNLEEDAYPVRLFMERGLQMMVAASFSKNMGLYGERVGALHLVCASGAEAETVRGLLRALVRPMYSSPPAAGAKVVEVVLSDPALSAQWREQLAEMSRRICAMRTALQVALKENGTPGPWGHIGRQRGMFGYTGLTPRQVELLRERHHVYLAGSGRLSVSGVTDANVRYLADCIKDAIVNAGGANE